MGKLFNVSEITTRKRMAKSDTGFYVGREKEARRGIENA
jgi:hypothetical protein